MPYNSIRHLLHNVNLLITFPVYYYIYLIFLLNKNQWNIFDVLSWITILCSIETLWVGCVFSMVTICRIWA